MSELKHCVLVYQQFYRTCQPTDIIIVYHSDYLEIPGLAVYFAIYLQNTSRAYLITYCYIQPPQPVEPWSHERLAVVQPLACSQLIDPTSVEDCLYLNIFTPDVSIANKTTFSLPLSMLKLRLIRKCVLSGLFENSRYIIIIKTRGSCKPFQNSVSGLALLPTLSTTTITIAVPKACIENGVAVENGNHGN